VDELLELRGIGRYTAGAIASIAYDVRAPILDGNVARVLTRIECIQGDPREPANQSQLWQRAEDVLPQKRIGDFNSALMELGATICTPRSPACLLCPVRSHCKAQQLGLQEQMPSPRKSVETPLERRWTICVEHNGQWLIEQRPPKGRWAGMWQFITVPARTSKRSALAVSVVKSLIGLSTTTAKHVDTIRHALTHRRYEFEIFRCRALNRGESHRKWIELEKLDAYPMSRPQLKVAGILRDCQFASV